MEYKDILKREGLKNTKHRNSILEIMEASDQPVTADHVYIMLREKSISINLSTVYRILEALTVKDLVIKSSIPEDHRALYELNRMEHKHHLICVSCKKMFSVEGCPLEEFEKSLKDRTGFDVTGHRLEIYGYCTRCKGNEK